MSNGARAVLEKAGVHLFKDASTNKGGVTSSSLEVLSALALPDKDHSQLMSYDPASGAEPPEFYQTYVKQVLDIIIDNAKQEFNGIWNANQQDNIPKVEATALLSQKINQITDSIQESLLAMKDAERDQLVRKVISQAIPPLMLQHLGMDGVLERVPPNYIGAIVGAWIGSRFVYRYGINASAVSFFLFMKELSTA